MADAAAQQVKRVVIIVQENHTVDNFFRGLAPYGGAVATDRPISPNPPAKDQPHDRYAPPPSPPIAPKPPPPPAAKPAPVGDIVLRDGSSLPPPNDTPLPQQPSPPRRGSSVTDRP